MLVGVQFVVPAVEVSTQVWFGVNVFVELPSVSVTTTTIAAVSLGIVLEDNVFVYMPVTSDGVTSSPGLEFGSLIVAESEPPEDPVNATPPTVSVPFIELTEQTVLFAVATKLPPLCAQTEEEQNNATAVMAREVSTTLVIVEQFFMIIFLL